MDNDFYYYFDYYNNYDYYCYYNYYHLDNVVVYVFRAVEVNCRLLTAQSY